MAARQSATASASNCLANILRAPGRGVACDCAKRPSPIPRGPGAGFFPPNFRAGPKFGETRDLYAKDPDVLSRGRSEDSRVGKACVSTCRTRWWTGREQKKKHTNVTEAKK